jgi:surface protein
MLELKKLTIFIFIIFFSKFSLANNCIKLSGYDFEFLEKTGACAGYFLETYNNSNINTASSKNRFNSLLGKNNNGGYTIHFSFDRADENITGDQTLVAFYENIADAPGTEIAKIGINSEGNFYHSHGTDNILLSLSDDVDFRNPHTAVIVYDTKRRKLILNIDGEEVYINVVEPLSQSNINKIVLGNNYVGKIGNLKIYATNVSIAEREVIANALSKWVKIKPKSLIKKRNGSFETDSQSASKACNVGAVAEGSYCYGPYNAGSDYTLPYQAADPGAVRYDNAANSSGTAIAFSCNSGYTASTSPAPSYYFNGSGKIQIQGHCVLSSSVIDPNCYSVAIGEVAPANFAGCGNMLVVDRAMLDSAIADGSYDFKPGDGYTSHMGNTYTFANDVNNIFTGRVTDMSGLFIGKAAFNADIGYWDVSKVTNMASMFNGAHDFNQDLNNWDTSNVTNMAYMFTDANLFNQDLNNWDTSNVTNMTRMFAYANDFNQDLNNWDTSNVTNMASMFNGAHDFNQDLNNWDTSNVTDMNSMFAYVKLFNQDLNNWDTSNVTDMDYMFYHAYDFNQNLNNWDTSNVTDMDYMFYHAYDFNQNLNNWDTSNVTDMDYMFYNANSFNQNLNNWDTSNVTNMDYMFYNAYDFNQDLTSWVVSGVTNCTNFAATSGLTAPNKPNFTGCTE